MVKHRGESSKMGQAGPLPQAVVGGLQVQLAHKLLEPLMRSATTNKTSVKLGILREPRRRNLELQSRKGAIRRGLQWWKPVRTMLSGAPRELTKGLPGSSLGVRRQVVGSSIGVRRNDAGSSSGVH
ncbi:hypothetical protein B296_00044345 [Ensete ventricosum]|uniref:Uncharacterized protein n=1 Tax=Ensete ventricosum TaxID=4639 RepID=A0A426YTJ2_ENSVE|nr:hypothetical protein B296_00044345 [Ensete ventricosum]